MGVNPYPWDTLERLSRRAVRDTRRARRLVARSLELGRLSSALTGVLGVETWVALRSVTADLLPQSVDVSFDLPGQGRLGLAAEPELTRSVLACVLGRAPPLTRPGAPLDESLRGALAAIVLEAARRTGGAEPLRVANHEGAGGAAVRVEASVVLDGKPYTARAWVSILPSLEPEAEPSLDRLGDIALEVPLVIALSWADPREIAGLAPGDAWMPAAAGWVDRRLVGSAALGAARSESAVAVHLAEDGSVVLGERTISLSADEANEMSSAKKDVQDAVAGAVLDAPVLVRVEVGSVSLSAREWAALEPGDVIETGRRINEPVVLRIAGREVARGELVEIEGELGVRIREIVSGEHA